MSYPYVTIGGIKLWGPISEWDSKDLGWDCLVFGVAHNNVTRDALEGMKGSIYQGRTVVAVEGSAIVDQDGALISLAFDKIEK